MSALRGSSLLLAAGLIWAHAPGSIAQFEAQVRDWLATARHPRFNRPYTDLVYEPMIELLAYLRANGFKTYIVSGGASSSCGRGPKRCTEFRPNR